jgi:hypothetical protein
MDIQNILQWIEEAEDNNCFTVNTQSLKAQLQAVQKHQLTSSKKNKFIIDFVLGWLSGVIGMIAGLLEFL